MREILLVIGGMIGAGKSTAADMLGKHYDSHVYYETVEGNHFLPLFYTASPEERAEKRYPFLLQLEFLNLRYSAIKNALTHGATTVMDRSIYEDWYFAKVNRDLGQISPEEFRIYEGLLNNMMEELKDLPKKAPDLFIYLKASSFNTIMERIESRGRDFEQNDSLVGYYWELYQGYDNWVNKHYSASEVLEFDITKMDFRNSEDDRKFFFSSIDSKLKELGVVDKNGKPLK